MSKSEDLVFVKGNHWPVLRIFSPIQMIRHCITYYIKLFKYLIFFFKSNLKKWIKIYEVYSITNIT